MVAVLPTKLDELKKKALDLAAHVDTILQVKPQLEGGIDFYEEVKRFEMVLIRWALQEKGGNQTRAARLLGLSPSTLNHMIRRYGI